MSNSKAPRRAYIGNLRPRPNLSQNLYNDLFVPHCLSVKNYPDDEGIVVVQPNTNTRNNAYALVEFSQVDYAIQVLNGVQFDGRTLRVNKEKKTFGTGGNWGGGFGSSCWAGDDGRSRRPKAHRKNHKESRTVGDTNYAPKTAVESDVPPNSHGERIEHNGEQTIVKGIKPVISSEITGRSDDVTAAAVCTIGGTLVSSLDALGLDEESDALTGERYGHLINGLNPRNEAKEKFVGSNMAKQDFQSRCQLPLSALLSEYGEQDVDWKKQQQQSKRPQDTNNDFQTRCQLPLSDLLEEYGEEDVAWRNVQQQSFARDNKKQNSNNATPKPRTVSTEQRKDDSDNGMLAHFKKASIHLELVSFGYKYGAPSHSKKGFTFAQPLPPLDVRDLDRAPGHISKFTGLSYLVKKSLLNPSKFDNRGRDAKGDDTGCVGDQQCKPSPMNERANEIADEIIKALVEAIDEGGHGAISPLTMSISVGSEYGRHRAVVLVERLAVILRARLRRNDGQSFQDTRGDENNTPSPKNGIVKQPVSVSTRHRDVEARHRDEEAFGEDLKREAKKAEKARRRQMEDSGWDDHGW